TTRPARSAAMPTALPAAPGALTQPHSPLDADEFPSFAAREAEFAAVSDTLRTIIESQKQEIHEYALRTLVLRNYAEALDGSASWRLLAPLRWLRRQLRPRGFTGDHLLAWTGLEPVAA